jgi:hypothetical protein
MTLVLKSLKTTKQVLINFENLSRFAPYILFFMQDPTWNCFSEKKNLLICKSNEACKTTRFVKDTITVSQNCPYPYFKESHPPARLKAMKLVFCSKYY